MDRTDNSGDPISLLGEWISSVSPGVEISVDKYGAAWLSVDPGAIRRVIGLFKERGYRHLITITGTDLISEGSIELIYHLAPVGIGGFPILNIRTKVPRDKPSIDSITDIHNIAILYEREIFDLLGVIFIGHPNLGRILLPKDTPQGYHPLRKDFKEVK